LLHLKKGQETPTSWPLHSCPWDFEGVDWIVGKKVGKVGKLGKLDGKER